MVSNLEQFIPYSVDKVFNDNPNLMEFLIPKDHMAWYDFRKNGFGASEIGTIVGVNPYNILPFLIEEKIGLRPIVKTPNEKMVAGLISEKVILERWKFWDGGDTTWVDNYTNSKVIRECTPVSSYIINTKYPRLFVSLDAKIGKGQYSLLGKKLTKDVPLECKTISMIEAKKWTEGIPAQYRYQINTQMLVTETDYAELATLEDGYKFKVHVFEADKLMQAQILEKTEEAYQTMVKLAEIKKQLDYSEVNGLYEKASELRSKYESIMPLPGDQDLFKDYYSEKMYADKQMFMGSINDYKLGVLRMKYAHAIKVLESEKQQVENLLMRRFVEMAGEYMDFGKQGKIRYYQVEGRKNHQFSFTGLKAELDKKGIERTLNQIQ